MPAFGAMWETAAMIEECALRLEFLPETGLSRVIVWGMGPQHASEIVDILEGEIGTLLDMAFARYVIKYLVNPDNTLREGDPTMLRETASRLHAYLVEFPEKQVHSAESSGMSGTGKADVNLSEAPIIQQILNLRCRVIIDNDMTTAHALRAVMDRMADVLVNHLIPIVRGELDTIIDKLKAANFEAAFTAQITVEPADESHRELARAIGETRQ